MDCPSEEQLIKMKLSDVKEIRSLDFDISNRTLIVYHEGNSNHITNFIDELNLDSNLIETTEGVDALCDSHEQLTQKKILWAVLLINFAFFLIEMSAGIISNSMGLVADSLDMFADAAVYGMSLLAIGKVISTQKLVAKIAGYFQFTLAVVGIIEVTRRFIETESIPSFETMIIVSAFALIGNIISLYLLQKSNSKEAHMRASMIFTSNDIIVNAGVIIAGVLVSILASKIPDLIVGAIVFGVVIRGSFRILKLAK